LAQLLIPCKLMLQQLFCLTHLACTITLVILSPAKGLLFRLLCWLRRGRPRLQPWEKNEQFVWASAPVELWRGRPFGKLRAGTRPRGAKKTSAHALG